MRSILLALDGTPAAAAARRVAIFLAAQHRARLAAIGVVDRDYLTAPEPMPLGASHYKAAADLARVKRAGGHLSGLVARFEADCRQQGVSGVGTVSEGDPTDELLCAAQLHDLVVIGQDTAFRSEPLGQIAAMVEKFLARSPRPALVTPPHGERLSPILIAYDGSAPAARALQLFALLGMAAGAEVHVTAIQPAADTARALADRAASYLKLYDIAAAVHPLAASADPAEMLLDSIRSIGVGMVVMGAFGHRGWREALLGSCTRALLRECPTGLFVHH